MPSLKLLVDENLSGRGREIREQLGIDAIDIKDATAFGLSLGCGDFEIIPVARREGFVILTQDRGNRTDGFVQYLEGKFTLSGGDNPSTPPVILIIGELKKDECLAAIRFIIEKYPAEQLQTSLTTVRRNVLGAKEQFMATLRPLPLPKKP